MTVPKATGHASFKSGGTLLVRHAEPADLEELLALYAQLAPQHPSPPWARPPRAREIHRMIRTQAGRHLLVADLQGALVGSADLLVAVNLTHGGRPWAIVENVVVDEAVRDKGVGRALFDEVLRIARDAGCYKVQLLSRKERSAAHEFYKRIGFEAAAEGFRLYLD